MATIVLSAAGAAIGSSVGGSVFGLSTAVIGRAVGATVGRAIDQRLFGGSAVVETGRVDRFRLTGASEGAPMGEAHGRIRVGGQVIWASRFSETVTTSGGGKGGPSQPETRSYSYSVSLAVALVRGPISAVGRIWADGVEIAKNEITMRVYTGSETQAPDAKIEAVEGAGVVPAYRGVAYVVFEDLPLGRFGNRVPQFSFEVIRTGGEDIARKVTGVAMIPGTGEYALATTPVTMESQRGVIRTPNVNTIEGIADMEMSLRALTDEAPNCRAVSLVVSWFGDDLRCGSCQIRPRVEQKTIDGKEMPWRVSGLSRGEAGIVPLEDGRPVYGGTPCDASVIEGIRALVDAGQAVTYYPFILMEQMPGNALADPYGGAEQAKLPWRGRITSGATDGTAAAEAEVAAFFGTASGSDFAVSGSTVSYTGGDGFSYRRFILHQAHLCAVAGGVDAFCIGSEMRGLTRIRGAHGGFPAVAALKALAGDVRAILGSGVKIGYAADWSEYFGHHPQDGSGDVFFHLDPLWADADIDFIGIDNYMPLSDWRDGPSHADAAWGAPYDPAYLGGNVMGGEGFDWFYASDADRAGQIRTPISDGAHGEPWVYRYKDLVGWWSNAHHERIGGVRQASPTDWVPGSKPIWFTEYGCAAVDKGTNQPNKFLDPKSSESSLPYFSTGARDDLIQQQYLRAMVDFWEDASNNPQASAYQGRMVDTSRMFAWAWDARPFPAFPQTVEVWSDGENYRRGHWLNGRITSRSLAQVVSETCARSGVSDVDVTGLYGIVRGYALAGGETAREALQPLLLVNGADASDRGASIRFRTRDGRVDHALSDDALAMREAESALTLSRSPDAETSGRVRLTHVEADGGFDVQATDSIFPDEATTRVSETEVALSLTGGEAGAAVSRWLAEARVGRDTVVLGLPPSSEVGAGDVVALSSVWGDGRFRVDRVEDAGLKLVEAVRVEEAVYDPPVIEERPFTGPRLAQGGAVWAEFLDLPLLRGDEATDAPYIAATADPWPGAAALYSSVDGEGWTFETDIGRPATMGETLTPLPWAATSVLDRGAGLDVRLTYGALSSITELALLNGGNAAAIGVPGGPWEVFQFRVAELIGERTYRLSERLRGQRGTGGIVPEVWPAGAVFVLLDGGPKQIASRPDLRGVARQFRIGPARRTVDHRSYTDLSHVGQGTALRPYRPVHLGVRREADGSVLIDWIRQTRIDGDGWDGEAPIGETFERYAVRVRVGGAVVRQVETAVTNWTYGAAEQAADGVTGGFAVEVAQISDRYGPGLYGRIEVDG